MSKTRAYIWECDILYLCILTQFWLYQRFPKYLFIFGNIFGKGTVIFSEKGHIMGGVIPIICLMVPGMPFYLGKYTTALTLFNWRGWIGNLTSVGLISNLLMSLGVLCCLVTHLIPGSVHDLHPQIRQGLGPRVQPGVPTHCNSDTEESHTSNTFDYFV